MRRFYQGGSVSFLMLTDKDCTMSQKKYFTQEGYDKLKKELEYLTTRERAKIANQIAEAREKGDLSENAEYDAAKEAQGLLELRINKMQEVLANARVLDEKSIDTSKVQVLTTVRVMNRKLKKEQKFTLVTETEADFKKGKISTGSPIGNGLLGKKVGDVINIPIPNGSIEFEILEITVE